MPFGYEETRLWRSSLGETEGDRYTESKTRLRVAYHTFRERAALLAAEIPQDLRDFTVHDVTHLDALWELADLICGPEISITPTEGFVLGGAFLIHDLGMGLAAWPDGMQALEEEPGYRDTLASCLADTLGRSPNPEEFTDAPPNLIKKAREITLREKHASHAADLALITWNATGTETSYHLIQDEDLRAIYGHLIGRIAASHWWPIDALPSEFGTPIGAPVDCPDEWIVDPLKLACILRLADIAHIDARRAPAFLRAIRNPADPSDQHWVFQSYLQRPRLEEDHLVYTSARPFPQNQASAWWLCYESLNQIDRELSSVDALFVDENRSRLAARAVKAVNNPIRLRSLIPTDNWTPVDARIAVTNIPNLVKKLGGKSLYGDQSYIGLRELIQNASDATRALRAMTGSDPRPIVVSLENDSGQWILRVSDSGVGMSQQVLTGALLDFGHTFWGSDLMRHELPGLASSNFRAIGKYGIGFYATFMLGNCVKVVTRRYTDGSADTRVLEFEDGLDYRPIIRPAHRDEVLNSSGTTISVVLNKDPYEQKGLFEFNHLRGSSLADLCTHIAPALPSDLAVVEPGETQKIVIRADDWKTIPGEELIQRLGATVQLSTRSPVAIEEAAKAVRSIEQDGRIVARGCLLPNSGILALPDGTLLQANASIVTEGLHVKWLSGVVGVFEALPEKADRSMARLCAEWPGISAWASEQGRLWNHLINKMTSRLDSTLSALSMLGGDLSDINVGFTSEGLINGNDLAAWAQEHTDIVAFNSPTIDVMIEDSEFSFWDYTSHKQLELPDNFIVFRGGGMADTNEWHRSDPEVEMATYGYSLVEMTPERWYRLTRRAVSTTCLSFIAKGWGCDLEEVIQAIRGGLGDDFYNVPLSDGSGESAIRIAWQLTRPTSSTA